MEERVIAPHASTPAGTTLTSGGLGFMPSDLLEQTCKRVGVAALVFAAIWAWTLVMNNVVWRLFDTVPDHEPAATGGEATMLYVEARTEP